jgi:hypothetical protein
MPAGHERCRIANGELPARDIHTQMRLTHLEEGLTPQQSGEEGIDLREGIAHLHGPQIRC